MAGKQASGENDNTGGPPSGNLDRHSFTLLTDFSIEDVKAAKNARSADSF